MIVTAIMELLKGLLLFIIGLMPKLPDMTGLKPYVDSIFDVLSAIDSFVDVRVFCICILVLIGIMLASLIWAVVMWVVKKIPGVS